MRFHSSAQILNFSTFSYFTLVDVKGNSSKDDDGGGRWHLKNAIRPESDRDDLSNQRYAGRAFHPQCYQDRNSADLNDTSASIDPSSNEPVSTSNLSEETHNTNLKKDSDENSLVNDFDVRGCEFFGE